MATQNSLDLLLRQPAVLEEQRRQIRQEMESLAFQNYPVFLKTASCATVVHSEVRPSNAVILQIKFVTSCYQMRSAGARLDSVIAHLPELASACQGFTKKTASINKVRQQRIKTLKQHPSLLEMLELPQLLDTCIRVRTAPQIDLFLSLYLTQPYRPTELQLR